MRRQNFDEAVERFSDAIEEAETRVEANIELRTMNGETPAAAGTVWLKNNVELV